MSDPAAALRMVEQVLAHHRRRLLERAHQHPDNEHFQAGIAWAMYALDRAARAAAGVIDRERLGLNDDPRRPPPLPPTGADVSKQIDRYRVLLDGSTTVLGMPAGAVILTATPPPDGPPAVDLWAIVDPHAPSQQRHIHVVGTASGAPPEDAHHIGTFVAPGGFVWHVFDGGPV